MRQEVRREYGHNHRHTSSALEVIMSKPLVRVGSSLLFCMLAGCAGPPAGQRSESTGATPVAAGPKRLVTVIMAEPSALYRGMFRGSVIQAQDVSDFFVNSGLTAMDSQGI